MMHKTHSMADQELPPLDIPAETAARCAIISFATYYGEDAAPLIENFDQYYDYLSRTSGAATADHYARYVAADLIMMVRLDK